MTTQTRQRDLTKLRPWQGITDDLVRGRPVTGVEWAHLFTTAQGNPIDLGRHLRDTVAPAPALPPATTAVLWLTNHCELPPRLHRRPTRERWTLDRDTLDRTLATQPDRLVIGSHISSELRLPGFESASATRQYELFLSYIRDKAPQAELIAASLQEVELWQVTTGCPMAYGIDLLAAHGVTALTGFHEWPLVQGWRDDHEPRLIAVDDWTRLAQHARQKDIGLHLGLPLDSRISAGVWRQHWHTLARLMLESACQPAALHPWVSGELARSAMAQWVALGLPAFSHDLPVHSPWPMAEKSLLDWLTDGSTLAEQVAQGQETYPWTQPPAVEWLAFAAVTAGCWQGLESVWHDTLNQVVQTQG